MDTDPAHEERISAAAESAGMFDFPTDDDDSTLTDEELAEINEWGTHYTDALRLFPIVVAALRASRAEVEELEDLVDRARENHCGCLTI